MTDIIPPQGLPLNPTAQQVFDRVARHLLTQNQRALRPLVECEEPEARCAYRAGSLSCAVGCLIPDEVYNPAWEGEGLTALNKSTVWFGLVGLKGHTRFLQELQEVHDEHEPYEWYQELLRVARGRGLSTAAIPNRHLAG